MDGPILTTYILLLYPFIWRLWQRAVETLQRLSQPETKSSQLAVEHYSLKRRWEWVALIAGVALWLSLQQPWTWTWWPERLWLSIYDTTTQMILFGLLGWLIFTSLAGSRYLGSLSRQQLKLNIFNPGSLTPIASSSLGLSLAFIGGISLSMIFQTQETFLRWNNIIIYAVLVCVTVALFFLSMWSVHRAMAKDKKNKLALANRHLAEASHKLEEQTLQNKLEGLDKLSLTISAWGSYERLIRGAQVWPFNAGIIRRLVASTVVPFIVFIIRAFLGQRLGL